MTNLCVDLVFFSGPDARALQLYSHHYIFSIWDLAHLEHPEFPEASAFGEFERREHLYRNGARRAVAVIADSQASCRMISVSYGVPSERIFAAPFLMSRKGISKSCMRIRLDTDGAQRITTWAAAWGSVGNGSCKEEIWVQDRSLVVVSGSAHDESMR